MTTKRWTLVVVCAATASAAARQVVPVGELVPESA
jgi:hypothetical protein